MPAPNKLTLAILFFLACGLGTPAIAQLDGDPDGGSVDLETEDMPEDDRSGEIDSGTPDPTPAAPGTLDAPGSAPAQPRAGGSRQRPANSYSDDVIFDWSKYENATEVPHPFAEKGLIRIDKSRNYIYKVEESEQKTATAVRFGSYIPQNLEAPANDNVGSATFEDLYTQTDTPAILIDWEWQLWRSPIGKFAASLGGGVYVAQGNGRFVGPVNSQAVPEITPKEIFTFAVIPMSIGAVYRMQIWHKQMVVPYATGGGTIFGFAELRDDDKAPKFGGSFGAFYAAGGALNLTYFDNMSRIQLDREYGINAVYLTVEYRGILALSKKFDFSGDMLNAGFLMEY